MIGKALNSRPWITRSYEPFINEPCDKSSEDVSGENVCQKSPDFDDTDNAIYLLPPPSSSTTCLPPNPDPPEFNVQAEPIVVEPRGRSCNALIPGKSSSCTENVDPFYADSLRLQKEILNPGGIEVYVAASELLSNVALIQLQSQVWIAGWNPRVSSLHGLFHVGDLLVSVNGCDVQNLRQVAKVVEGTKKWALRENFRTPADVKCRLRLRRLPLAKTLIVCRQRQDQKIGITFDENGTNQF
uniref:PDZ domain-containing protein n=1 Tax=Mesocestoides corti TaxID=53468 RepID=A0A5K3ELS0_MESCO